MKNLFKVLLPALLLYITPVPAQEPLQLTMEKALEIAAESSPDMKNSLMSLERSQLSLLAQHASLKSRFSLNLSPAQYSKRQQYEEFNGEWYKNETFSTQGTFSVEQPILLTDGTISLRNTFGWQYSNTDRSSGSGSSEDKAFSNNLRLELEQPIFTYNTRKMELKQLEFEYENSLISYALQRLRTESSITSQFYNLYMAQKRLEISKEELANAKQSYDIIVDKVDADLAAKGELFQAEINYANAQSSYEQSIVSLENTKDNFKKALGLDIDTDIVALAEIDDVERIEVDGLKAVEYAMASRLELRQREITAHEQEFAIIRAKAQNEFKGEINLSLGIQGVHEDVGKLFDRKVRVMTPAVGVSFSVPIFDWGANKARVKAQEIAQQQNELNTEEEKKDIKLNIRSTIRSLNNLKVQIKIAEQSLKNAQLTYDLNVIRYREGDLTGMEMNQFQTQLSNQKMSYSQSLIDYKIELLNLKILTLYDYEKGEPIVPMSDLIVSK